MLRKKLTISALSLSLIFAGSSAVLAGEGDYYPSQGYETRNQHQMESMQNMNHKSEKKEMNNAIQCRVTAALTHKDDRGIPIEGESMTALRDCQKLES